MPKNTQDIMVRRLGYIGLKLRRLVSLREKTLVTKCLCFHMPLAPSSVLGVFLGCSPDVA